MKILKFILIVAIGCFSAIAAFGMENKLSLTVTPPLFQVVLEPGEEWASKLKIVNTNGYDLTVYAVAMDFSADGEDGHGKFTPVIKDKNDSESLAGWINVSKKPIFIPAEKSAELPFAVKIPDNVQPGGHYAAILVGTAPTDGNVNGSAIKISTMVSSLFFVKIKGDVLEKGRIREFKTEKYFYQEPNAIFDLRFENEGNVHLQPKGDVVIYNMWGEEKGRIQINQKSDFGNVLPGSVRKFVFDWRGGNGLSGIGRYKAVASVVFGENGTESAASAAYFWVLPIKTILSIAGGAIFLIALIILLIKFYIRRTLDGLNNESLRKKYSSRKKTKARDKKTVNNE
ncbi:MAG: hypothetical protein PHY40_01745 [Patescibacteria group bacterium]|nr:hypothetical protein [Patescibacteria group bacterium]